MMNFTPEMIEKARGVNSPEDLIALAKEYEIALTEDESAMYFAQLNPKMGEMDDDELEMVSGGGCGSEKKESPYWYDVFQKKPYTTHVKHTQGRCPECYKKLVYNQEFNLYWETEETKEFSLYCLRCGYKWRDNSFRFDPRTHGIYPA